MKYKASALKIEASQIKQYIEKNKKVPKACTLSTGETISPYSIAYLFSLMVKDTLKNSTYDLINVIIYNTGKAHKDTINADVVKKDYMIMIDNFLKFCRKYHRVPRYITVPSLEVKVSFELYLYAISKIVLFIDKNKKLPKYCNFTKSFSSNTKKVTSTVKKEVKKSTSTSKKTNTCSNPYTSSPNLPESERGQNTSYGCANNGEQEALYKLTGKIFKESELAKLSATTTKGTSHSGINTCIAAIAKKLGIKLTVKWVNFSSLGKTMDERFEALGKIICQSNKAVITHIAYMNGGEEPFNPKDKWFGHYEPIKSINTKTKTVKVLNSLGYKKASGGYKGHIQDRSFKVEASYLANTSGGQPSICIITKG